MERPRSRVRLQRVESIAYLGLGGNLGAVAERFDRAIELLERRGVRTLRRASLYRTAPIGPPGQPDYTNTVLEVATPFSPEDLLPILKAIEEELGRAPGERWGPRVIDLDLLLHGRNIVREEHLTVPHHELKNRRFVLAPLAELAPDLVVPGLDKTVGALLDSLTGDPSEVVKIAARS